jgi:hypothetical protein
MGTDEGAQGLGHGEGEHEVMGRQAALQLRIEPSVGLVLLAGRAVAIAAAARQQLLLRAGLTPVEQCEITLGQISRTEVCAITASDEDQCLAMLQRRKKETLVEMLDRLDAAIAHAWEDDEFIDEINA